MAGEEGLTATLQEEGDELRTRLEVEKVGALYELFAGLGGGTVEGVNRKEVLLWLLGAFFLCMR